MSRSKTTTLFNSKLPSNDVKLNLNFFEFLSVSNYIPLNGFVFCVEVLRPSQPNGVMSSAVSLPNHTFTGQA